MRKHIFGIAIVMLAAGCGASPPPVAKTPPGPPAPPAPPAVAVAPAPAPVAPPVTKPAPPVLPRELIAKVEELTQMKAAATKAKTEGTDGTDQAFAAAEQLGKGVTLALEVQALVAQLTPEQQAEFKRRYPEFLGAIATPPTTPVPATP
jgi:hypothetical protein